MGVDWWFIYEEGGVIIRVGLKEVSQRDRTDMSTSLQVLERRKVVWERYLKGDPQWVIARDLEISDALVSYDLKELRQEWAEKYRSLDDQKLEELARLDSLEVKLREAWERSLEDKETVTEEIGPGGQVLKTTIQRTGQIGDPRYVSEITKIIGIRCRILGLEAPTKILSLQIRWDLVSRDQKVRIAQGEDFSRVLEPHQYSYE